MDSEIVLVLLVGAVIGALSVAGVLALAEIIDRRWTTRRARRTDG